MSLTQKKREEKRKADEKRKAGQNSCYIYGCKSPGRNRCKSGSCKNHFCNEHGTNGRCDRCTEHEETLRHGR
jgi:uncharacterized membrane protein